MSDQKINNALAAMAAWRDFRGLSPFAFANSAFGIDRCNEFLGNASAILSMLSAAAEDSGSLVGSGRSSEFDSRAGVTMAGALDGVANLINLSAFMLGGAE